jgi:hypothetical protein
MAYATARILDSTAFIGDPTYADAILDRLVHNAHRIDLAGDSLRRRRSRSIPKDSPPICNLPKILPAECPPARRHHLVSPGDIISESVGDFVGICRFERRGMRSCVHPHDFPDVAVRILNAAVEHEAVILHRVGIGATARGNGPGQRRIHRIALVDAERQQCLAVTPRVADRAKRELTIAVVREQHHTDRVRKHDRRRLLVRKLHVHFAAERDNDVGTLRPWMDFIAWRAPRAARSSGRTPSRWKQGPVRTRILFGERALRLPRAVSTHRLVCDLIGEMPP